MKILRKKHWNEILDTIVNLYIENCELKAKILGMDSTKTLKTALYVKNEKTGKYELLGKEEKKNGTKRKNVQEK